MRNWHRMVSLNKERFDQPRFIYIVLVDSEITGLPNVEKFDSEREASRYANKHNGRVRQIVIR
jgi:hypothetical protein